MFKNLGIKGRIFVEKIVIVQMKKKNLKQFFLDNILEINIF